MPVVPDGYGTVTPWVISTDSAGLIRFLEAPAFFRLYLEDADTAYAQALAAGATSVTRVTELFWGDRVGRVRDPFGNIWWLQSHVADVPPDEMQARMTEPAMVEAMQYVQQSLIDALRA